MAPHVEALAAEFGDKLVMSKIDCTKVPHHKQWAKGHGVKALPTWVVQGVEHEGHTCSCTAVCKHILCSTGIMAGPRVCHCCALPASYVSSSSSYKCLTCPPALLPSYPRHKLTRPPP